MIEGILVEGFIYAIMALGVFITFRILDFPDLTVDGSFPLGAALAAYFIINGYNLWIALFFAFVGGFAAGCLTATLHNRLRIPNLLAGIITMTMLYSINIRILGNRANQPLLKKETILTQMNSALSDVVPSEYTSLLLCFIIITVIMIFLDIFFRTGLGLSMKALGNNEQMVVSQGVNPNLLKLIGVGLSNALVALSGAFAAQYLGFADVGMGQGIIIAGLASVMLGEFLIKSNKIAVLTICAIAGSILFKAIMYFGRYYGYYVNMTPNDLKLITGLMIIASLFISKTKSFKLNNRKKS